MNFFLKKSINYIIKLNFQNKKDTMEDEFSKKFCADPKKLIYNSIPIENIKNKGIYNGLIDDLVCLVCLNIPIEPIQCSKCDIVLCKNCLEILNISQKNCLSQECQSSNIPLKRLFLKTTKFVKEILEQLIIKCEFCGVEKIEYSKFKNHLKEKCEIYKNLENRREFFIKELIALQKKEEDLKTEIETAKFSKLQVVEKEDSSELIAYIRQSLITNVLGPVEKKNLHNAIVDGNIIVFKGLINDRKYPIFEEISAKSYFWTSIHYAMHYGKWNIIEFCLKYFNEKNLFDNAMKLRSNDNRCPILCMLKSNTLKNEEKKNIFEKLIKEFDIPISNEVRKEIIARNFKDILEKYKK